MGKDRAEIQVDAAVLAAQRRYSAQIREIFAQRPRRPRALVHTYGCQQNFSDSERIQGMLEEMGYRIAQSDEDADLILFNTCAVREHAEQRVFGNVGALKALKAGKPSLLIGVCGCMMQEESAARRIRTVFPFVDLIFGTHVIHRLPELLYRLLTQGGHVIDTRGSEGVIVEGLPVRRAGKLKAWLPIMYGCDNFCSYCIVPYVRGRERSREPQTVLAEARGLVAAGYKDITLLGQNVNSYGKDLPGGYPFARLLREIDAIPGDFRIRFMTSHPKDATEALFHAMADCPKVTRHIHLPFQAGSDRVLRAMNRRYTREQYLALIDRARAIVPGVSLTSDVIVGFPGETYAEFQQTLDIVRRVEFDGLFTFIYSPRQGTPAARMADPVPHGEKTRWMAKLLAAQDEIGARRLRRFAGRTVRVLCEGPGKTGPGWMTGRTESNTIVDFPAGPEMAGRFCPVHITQLRKFMLLGELDGPDARGEAPAGRRGAEKRSG